jgi:hypothetical protein
MSLRETLIPFAKNGIHITKRLEIFLDCTVDRVINWYSQRLVLLRYKNSFGTWRVALYLTVLPKEKQVWLHKEYILQLEYMVKES